ncbi:hypothetical protein GCM10017752_28770 [Streptomyces roseoviridis]
MRHVPGPGAPAEGEAGAVAVLGVTDVDGAGGGPRYATRKDFFFGEDVTLADGTISTDGPPRYPQPEASLSSHCNDHTAAIAFSYRWVATLSRQ